MLTIKDYKKTYGAVTVLDIPRLELDHNMYWIKGENGAGKTTFLKSAAGLIPFNGDISFQSHSIRKQRRDYLKRVNYGAAEPLFPSFLSGWELIEFYLSLKGGDPKKAAALARDLHLDKYLKAKIGSYSTGMVKKLSLILAFVGEPGLILLDEPFITLDAEAIDVLKKLIQDAYRSGVVFCLSTHQDPGFENSIALPIEKGTITAAHA
jgi:ABC-2 type transport system ATP-binding protein